MMALSMLLFLFSLPLVRGYVDPSNYNEKDRKWDGKMDSRIMDFPYFNFLEPIWFNPKVKNASIPQSKIFQQCDADLYWDEMLKFQRATLSLNWTQVRQLRVDLWRRMKANHSLAKAMCYKNDGSYALMCGFMHRGFHRHQNFTYNLTIPERLDHMEWTVGSGTYERVYSVCRCYTHGSFISEWDPVRQTCVIPDGAACGPAGYQCKNEDSYCVGDRVDPRREEFCVCDTTKTDPTLNPECEGKFMKDYNFMARGNGNALDLCQTPFHHSITLLFFLLLFQPLFAK